MLGFTVSIYKRLLLKCSRFTVKDSNLVLTVQPNLHHFFPLML